MTTVCVKFKSPSKDGGQGTVYYQITRNRQRRCIKTTVRCFHDEWDASRGGIMKKDNGSPDIRQIQIDSDVKMLCGIVDSFEKERRGYTSDDVLNTFCKRRKTICVLPFMKEEVLNLQWNQHWRTARNYKRTQESFSAFLNGLDITFPAMTEELVGSYGRYLVKRGLVPNSISFYMRVLRAVYNKAVKRKLVEQPRPFANVYTGIAKTDKRAVDFNVILDLNRLELDTSHSLALTRDLFLFSFLTRGMSFVDMAYLRKSAVSSGEIRYVRQKTKRRLLVRVNRNIESILLRYDNNNTPYVFPLLKSEDPQQAYHEFQTQLTLYNRRLKILSRMMGLPKGLTSYTARHSWATTAYRMGIPLPIISAGMGHSKEETTRIYLDSLENWKIDNANDEIAKQLSSI